MKKIKILNVGLSNNLGGIEKYLINIFRNIDKSKFELDFLVYKGEKVCFYDEISKESNIYELTRRTDNYYRYIKELGDFFKKSDYDYIHFHLMEFSCFERIILAQKYTKARIILHSHIANHKLPSFKTKVLNFVGKILVKKNDSYLKAACSMDAGRYMFSDFKDNNFVVLNNGIDIIEFKFNNDERIKMRKKLNLCGKFVIGNIGRFVTQKNHTFLLEIFKYVKEIKPNASLLLIGSGKLKKRIIKKAQNLKVLDSIIFIDKTNEVPSYLAVMDKFVFPSLFEGLGIVLIEAQASGLECYVTDSLPNEINISNNITRISLKQDAQYWAKKITQNEESIENREKENERIKKESNFDIKKSVNILEKFYITNMERK